MKEQFIRTTEVQQWLEKLATLQPQITAQAKIADENNTFVSANIEALRKIGYGKITLPKKDGGEGLSLYDAIVLQETLGSYDASTALAIGWTLLTVGELYENRYWTEEMLLMFAKEVQQGAIVNRAVSEVATGSPIRGGKPTTTATRHNTQYTLNGKKGFTTCAYALDYFLISAWLEDKEQVGFFLVHKDTAGLTIEDNWHMLGMRGTGSHDLVIDHVTVDEHFLVEIPSYHTGFKLNAWLLLIPATYLGIAQAARDIALDFANRYQPNSIDTTIAHLPNVQAQLGEIDLLLTQARFAIYGAAEAIERGNAPEQISHLVNIAKYTVTNHAIAIVDLAMRVVGAKSLQQENTLQRLYRDVRAGLHNPPMDDLTITLLAKFANTQWEATQHV